MLRKKIKSVFLPPKKICVLAKGQECENRMGRRCCRDFAGAALTNWVVYIEDSSGSENRVHHGWYGHWVRRGTSSYVDATGKREDLSRGRETVLPIERKRKVGVNVMQGGGLGV